MVVGHVGKSKDKEGFLFLQGVSNNLLLEGEMGEIFRESVSISKVTFLQKKVPRAGTIYSGFSVHFLII